jgi:hypothetical protein
VLALASDLDHVQHGRAVLLRLRKRETSLDCG